MGLTLASQLWLLPFFAQLPSLCSMPDRQAKGLPNVFPGSLRLELRITRKRFVELGGYRLTVQVASWQDQERGTIGGFLKTLQLFTR